MSHNEQMIVQPNFKYRYFKGTDLFTSIFQALRELWLWQRSMQYRISNFWHGNEG